MFYQHQKFMRVVDGHYPPEVTLNDGIWPKNGYAAQVSAELEKWLISSYPFGIMP